MILKGYIDAESRKVSWFNQAEWISYSLFNIQTYEVTLQTSENKGSPCTFGKTLSQPDKSSKKNTCHKFSDTPLFIVDAGSKLLPCDCKSDPAAIWKLGVSHYNNIGGQALMHTVWRKTKANAFGDFAYDFIEATSRNIESRKDVCFDFYERCSKWRTGSLNTHFWNVCGDTELTKVASGMRRDFYSVKLDHKEASTRVK